jgi:hypothetical protein
MKKLMAVVALVLSVSAFARENVTITYSGYEGWGRSYYSCDYAEARTETVLELFGATNVSVTCSGGLDRGHYWGPIRVKASFDLPVLAGNEVAETVKFRSTGSNTSCALNVKIVKSLLPSFDNVTVVKKNDSCVSASSSYSYEFSIVR